MKTVPAIAILLAVFNDANSATHGETRHEKTSSMGNSRGANVLKVDARDVHKRSDHWFRMGQAQKALIVPLRIQKGRTRSTAKGLRRGIAKTLQYDYS